MDDHSVISHYQPRAANRLVVINPVAPIIIQRLWCARSTHRGYMRLAQSFHLFARVVLVTWQRLILQMRKSAGRASCRLRHWLGRSR